MRKFLVTAAAVAAFAAPALAADLPPRPYTKAPPPYTPTQAVYNWTGFYVGGHLGGAFGGDGLGGNDGRFLGGVQGGADYQFANNWVLGLEAEYSWLASANSSLTFPGGSIVTGNDRGLGSVTGRLGYAWGPALLYAKGGYAFRDSSLGITDAAGVPQTFATTGNRDNGYTVGAGLEYMFAPNWSAKVEYQYYNFGKTIFVAGSPPDVVGTSLRNDEHAVKAGVNYRFGWGGPAASRY